MRIRFRSNWRGKLILQIEEQGFWTDKNDLSEHPYKKWRDAKISDLSEINSHG